MTEELKSCPFCGGNVVWCDEPDSEDVHTCHFIVCTECYSQFDTTRGAVEVWDMRERKVLARKNFNRRVV